MMSDLISRSALIESFEPDHHQDWYTPWIIEKINEQPTVKANLVVHGEWNEYEEEYNAWQCSECGKVWLLAYGTPKENDMNYCTKCGARMVKDNE